MMVLFVRASFIHRANHSRGAWADNDTGGIMKRAPKWLYMTSIAVTTTVGSIFYGVGLYESNVTLTDAGAVLIVIALLCAVTYTKVHP